MPTHADLVAQAEALGARGQADAALATYALACKLYPASAVAHHNLAGHLLDMGRYAEADVALDQAIAKGLDAPETWLVRARTLQGLGRPAEALDAYRSVLRRRPGDEAARREMAQLVWMTTEDVDAALESLCAFGAAHADDVSLALLRADILSHADQAEAAYLSLGPVLGRRPGVPRLQTTAAHLAAVIGRPEQALQHAQAASHAAPSDPMAMNALAAACLSVGDPMRAGKLAEGVLAASPFDQAALAYQATSWRMLGDGRYRQRYDYDRLVGIYQLETPKGWACDDLFLGDLAEDLRGRHALRAHPLNQSPRYGSQTPQLARDSTPVLRSFFQAADAAIHHYLSALGQGGDPVRARRTGGYRMRGAWSVRLRPGGYHANHIHPSGWISSAFYVSLPDTVGDVFHPEGWLTFGEPGVPTRPVLKPERLVKPRPGRLVLFPSYMWHGTTAFTGLGHRLSLAFDLLPA